MISWEREAMQLKAVENNAGCYYIDQHQTKQFAWIEQCEQKGHVDN